MDRHTERLLEKALSSNETPDEQMNLHLKAKMREADTMRQMKKPVFRTAVIAVAILLCLTATAFAAIRLLTPAEVATQVMGSSALAAAFEGPDALIINETATDGPYTATLLGITSGGQLEGTLQEEVNTSKTYAVVAIEKENAPEGWADEEPLFVSPLVRGLTPWQVNAASMNGGYARQIIDGVLYWIVECDDVEIFADRGLYLCVSGTNFYSVDAYDYDEASGVITPNKAFEGLNVLFDLPMDAKKADVDAAAAYLAAFYAPKEEEPATAEQLAFADLIDRFVPDEGLLLEDSVQVLVPDEKGALTYTYETADGGSYGCTVLLEDADTFTEDRAGFSSELDNYIVIISKDDQGVFTGRVYRAE